MPKCQAVLVPFIYVRVTYLRVRLIRGHPFMTSTRRGEGVRLKWTQAYGGVQPHVDVHTEN